jgi:glutamate-1-semialdehyde 2,1-aminomutase
MKHPGTFNANPLSAAAGSATLALVAGGEPCARANAIARRLRQQLNALFAERADSWAAYGEFSGFRLLPDYHGPRPEGGDFLPYQGDPDRLDVPRPARLTHAFRQGMLLHGVDLPGLSGMVSAAHTEADVEHTVAAVAASLDLLKGEGDER